MGEAQALRLGTGIAVNALEEELQDAADFCRAEGIGIEVATFAFPEALDAPDLGARIERHRDALQGVAWIGVHGPFLDLFATSPDPAIVEVCRRRHVAAIGAARALGARLYVAHLNSLPQIRSRAYLDAFARRCADFWIPLADAAGRHDMVIALENLWERDPALQGRVVEQAAHPHLRASFDNGHALVFSAMRASDWIAGLGECLAHVHLHDNDRATDQHRPIGEGSEDWPALVEALRNHAPGVRVVVESDHLDANRQSLKALRRLASGTG
jgi:sugar phosphate isomerase/epimerase